MSQESAELPSASSSDPDPGEAYQIVADLLHRQDQVLQDLDELNSRVEEVIQSLVNQREADRQAQPVDAANEAAA